MACRVTKWRQVLLSKVRGTKLAWPALNSSFGVLQEIQEHGRWHLATCLVCEVATVTLNAIIVTALINSCARKSSQTNVRCCVHSVYQPFLLQPGSALRLLGVVRVPPRRGAPMESPGAL